MNPSELLARKKKGAAAINLCNCSESRSRNATAPGAIAVLRTRTTASTAQPVRSPIGSPQCMGPPDVSVGILPRHITRAPRAKSNSWDQPRKAL